MPYPKFKIAGREIIALVPGNCRVGDKHRSDGTLPEIHRLLRAVQDKVDAVAFAYVDGRWFPAA